MIASQPRKRHLEAANAATRESVWLRDCLRDSSSLASCGCVRACTLFSAHVWPFWKPLPAPLDSMLLLAPLGLLLLIAAVKRPRIFIATFLLLAVCAAWQDQSRWQPWFYQYFFMLAAIGLASSDRQDAKLITSSPIVI
jgi:hypothetical protein